MTERVSDIDRLFCRVALNMLERLDALERKRGVKPYKRKPHWKRKEGT